MKTFIITDIFPLQNILELNYIEKNKTIYLKLRNNQTTTHLHIGDLYTIDTERGSTLLDNLFFLAVSAVVVLAIASTEFVRFL